MRRILMFTACSGLLAAVSPASAQLGGDYNLSWNTLDGGGGRATGGEYNLQATIGQPDAGVMSAGIYRLTGGFWGGVPDAVVCAADFNSDGIVSSQDFFDFLVPFFAEDIAADFNHDASVSSQDFFDFIVAFFNGC